MTNPDSIDGISVKQEPAIDVTSAGRSLTVVAREFGLARQTVSERENRSSAFRAALNARRLEIRPKHEGRLPPLLRNSLNVLEREPYGERGVQAAGHLLRTARVYKQPLLIGSTSPSDLPIHDLLR